jgi:hypothetical protein
MGTSTLCVSLLEDDRKVPPSRAGSGRASKIYGNLAFLEFSIHVT